VSEDLDALWASAKPAQQAQGAEDLDALWEKAKPVNAEATQSAPRDVTKWSAADPDFAKNHPTLAAMGNAIVHPIDTLTDAPKRRELERGVGNAVTFGAANKLAGAVDPAFAASAAPDAVAAPGYRGAGEGFGMLLPNPAGAVVGKVVGSAIRAPAAAAADAVTAPVGAMTTGGKVAKATAHAIAHTVLDTIPHAVAHAAGAGSIGHSIATAADFAIEAAHLPQKAAGAMLGLVAKAHTEGWTSGKLAQAIVGLSSKATQATGTAASDEGP